MQRSCGIHSRIPRCSDGRFVRRNGQDPQHDDPSVSRTAQHPNWLGYRIFIHERELCSIHLTADEDLERRLALEGCELRVVAVHKYPCLLEKART